MSCAAMTRRRILSDIPSAVGLVAILALSGCSGGEQAAAPPRPAPEVGFIQLQSRSVPVVGKLTGRVIASVVAEVRPQVDGIVRSRQFNEGGQVKAGDVLYQIEPSTYAARLAKAQAALEKANADLPSAEARLKRYEGLAALKAVPAQEAETARTAVMQVRADIAAARADVESAEIDLRHTKVVAPVSGRIEKSSVTEGALVSAGQAAALTVIQSLEEVNVDIARPSADLSQFRSAVAAGRVQPNEEAKVSLEFDDGSRYGHEGRVRFSEATVDQSTGTYTVRASFPNPEGLLMPGMFVRAQVEDGTARSAFLVPQRAVSRNPKGEPVALFVAKDGKAEERVLETAGDIGNSWLVYKGVSDGDRLIVEGAQSARAGQAVNAVEVALDSETGLVVRQPAQTQPEQK